MIPDARDYTAARILWHGHAQMIRHNAPVEICNRLLKYFEAIEFHGASAADIYAEQFLSRLGSGDTEHDGHRQSGGEIEAAMAHPLPAALPDEPE